MYVDRACVSTALLRTAILVPMQRSGAQQWRGTDLRPRSRRAPVFPNDSQLEGTLFEILLADGVSLSCAGSRPCRGRSTASFSPPDLGPSMTSQDHHLPRLSTATSTDSSRRSLACRRGRGPSSTAVRSASSLSSQWVHFERRESFSDSMHDLQESRLVFTDPAALSHVLVARSYDYPKPRETFGFVRKYLGKGVLFAEVSQSTPCSGETGGELNLT